MHYITYNILIIIYFITYHALSYTYLTYFQLYYIPTILNTFNILSYHHPFIHFHMHTYIHIMCQAHIRISSVTTSLISLHHPILIIIHSRNITYIIIYLSSYSLYFYTYTSIFMLHIFVCICHNYSLSCYIAQRHSHAHLQVHVTHSSHMHHMPSYFYSSIIIIFISLMSITYIIHTYTSVSHSMPMQSYTHKA